MAQLIMAEGATPSTPSSGKASIFIDASGNLCKIDDGGNVMKLASAGSFTLTIPATGTVALLGTDQTFTGALTINKIIMGEGANLTIASGVVTITHSFHAVDTEGAASTDDLVTINGGVAGQRLILRTVSAARDVTIKHGAGNIFLVGSVDKTLASNTQRFELMYTGTIWFEIGL